MTDMTTRAGFTIDSRLARFLEAEVLGPLGRDVEAFWQGFAALLAHLDDGVGEVLATLALCEITDLDAALEWAARAPCVSAGSVEIRPVLPPPAA